LREGFFDVASLSQTLCDKVEVLTAPVIVPFFGGARFFLLLESQFLVSFLVVTRLKAALVIRILAAGGGGFARLRLLVARARFLLLLGDVRLLLDLCRTGACAYRIDQELCTPLNYLP